MEDTEEKFEFDWFDDELGNDRKRSVEVGYEVVVFRLADEFYAIDLRYIEEIRTIPAITRVPHGKDFLMGIASLRGNLFPVINIAKAFHLPVKEKTDNSRLIIFRLPEEMIAFFVDRVEGVERFQKDALKPSQDSMKLSSELYKGLFAYRDVFLAYIDLDKMLECSQFSEFFNTREDN